MKKLLLAAPLALAFCAALPAQQSSEPLLASAALPTAQPENHFAFSSAPALSAPALIPPQPQPALPDAPPAPQYGAFRDEGYKWDLGIGYEYVHFKASPFSLNLSGVHTDLTYNFKDWIGVEGNLISAFGGEVYNGRSTYVLYTVGPRIGWGPSQHRWSPWVHALVGGVHINPQTAAGSRNGFAFQGGGGADFRLWPPRVSLRAEADYVRSQLYSQGQNNFQVGLGAVIHF